MRTRGIKGLAAAASLGLMAMAGHAFAGNPNPNTFTLVSSSMDTEYVANIAGFGTAYDGPLTFTVSGYPGTTGTSTLFGFCFDIFHDMYLGNLGYTYETNQPTGGGLIPNSPQTLNAGQVTAITDLVDTGWIMEMQGTAPNLAAQEAAIQAAIWNVEDPGVVSGLQSWAGGAQGVTDTALVNTYYTEYSGGPGTGPNHYTNLADANDRVFTIFDTANDPAHQTFAIGWPLPGVPEPATWAMMLTGFFGMGSILRRNRKLATVTA